MSDELLKIVLQKVENMEHKITNAKSLNGGFDKLDGMLSTSKQHNQKFWMEFGG